MKVICPHKLGKDVALEKAKTALDDLQEKYGHMISNISESWDNYVGECSFDCYGFTIEFEIKVDDDRVMITGKVPWLLSSMENKIEQTLIDNMKKILAG